MSATKRIATVGASARASDFNAAANVAAAADDRALEVPFTPGATQKRVMPLSEETQTVNPRLLIVGKDTDGTLANGKVRVRPCYLEAGVLNDPYSIGLATKLKANSDSAVFGNNSSGSTRFDLLYATVSYATTATQSVREKPSVGGQPATQLITVQQDMSVVLNIVPGVASGNPLASLPSDAVDGSSYNIGLAMVALANGFSGGAVNQSTITPLWSSGWVQPQRILEQTPVSLYAGAANEKPGDVLGARWGAGRRFFAHFKVLSTTPTSMGVVLDNSMDWRNRWLKFDVACIGAASQFPLNAVGNSSYTASGSNILTGYLLAGSLGGSLGFNYLVSATIFLGVDTNGNLAFFRNASGTPQNGGGDGIVLMVTASDRILSTV